MSQIKVLNTGLSRGMKGAFLIFLAWFFPVIVFFVMSFGIMNEDFFLSSLIFLLFSPLLILIIYLIGVFWLIKGYKLLGQYFNDETIGKDMSRWFKFMLLWMGLATLYVSFFLSWSDILEVYYNPFSDVGFGLITLVLIYSSWKFYSANHKLAKALNNATAIRIAGIIYFIGTVGYLTIPAIFKLVGADSMKAHLLLMRIMAILVFSIPISFLILSLALGATKKEIALAEELKQEG